MKSSSFLKIRVTNIPLFWKPLFFLYSYITAALIYLAVLLARITCSFKISGAKNLKLRKNFIFCLWHSNIALNFVAFPKGMNHVWLLHPVWTLHPVNLFLRLMGVKKVIPGSSGNSGREAADELVEYLKKGYSTVVLPDGASGPPYVMKKGAFHMALQSGVPIVAIRFSASKFVALPTWDHKKIPFPFSKIRVEIAKPIIVSAHNFENALSEVESSLFHLP